jgi:DNA repair protein RecN (Recombination protein N)
VLRSLHIRNLAVLEEIELELQSGFSALTGETGAGKSMLVDALALALGERADSTVIRPGTQRAEITAIFDVAANPGAAAWLAKRDLESSRECHVRRVVTPEGRSRGFINGQPAPLELLRELGERLVEICGQHAHQSLLRRGAQRDILDAHGANAPLVDRLAQLHGAWTALCAQRQAFLARQHDQQARRELLSYQLRELQALDLHPGEFERLEQERVLLANVGRISAGLGVALERLYDSERTSAHDAIDAALREVQTLLAIDQELAGSADALEQAQIQVREAAEQIRRRLGSLEHDPARQDDVESRLSSALELSRKHRVDPQHLWQQIEALEAELKELSGVEQRQAGLDTELAGLEEQLRRAAHELHVARSRAALALAKAVTDNLRSLGMPGSTFAVRIDPLPHDQISASGSDQVEFLVGTNPGQPTGPVAKITSGGELSRLSLAIQVVAMTDNGAPTLIFDEVDAGIGGSTAEIVGQCLKKLSKRRQVLCVTHLPQVAAQADHHFAVAKSTLEEATQASVRQLTPSARIDEVARMLGGVTITERTRDHAKEMLHITRPRRAG